MGAPLSAVILLAVAASAADPAPKPVKASFIGEGGGYKAPDKETEGVLVGDQTPPPKPAAPAADAPVGPAQAAPAAPVPVSRRPASETVPPPDSSRPAPAEPSSASAPRSASPRIDASRPSAARPAASERNASIPGEAKPAGRQSLWNGLVQPLTMTAAAASEAADPDAARANADRDYETHILGMKGGPARGTLASPTASGSAVPLAPGAGGGKVFVSLAIDPREAGSLRDAVAGLGSSVGFAADPRFEAMPGPNGTVLYSGWLPAARLGDAVTKPGVKSLSVEPRARPSSPHETSGEFLVGLRVDDAAHAREGADAGVSALTSASGFHLTRVVGLETAPDGRSVAVVEGALPISRLSRAMGLPEVVKIVPVGGVPPAAAPPAEPGAGGLTGFAGFAARRGPWLIILTLLLLLPGLRDPARRAAEVFSPYR